ncbi:hypothetical protein MMC20_005306 [Loxospora ochrophaea]|nr:hypothetical protein [Loxospora ochrophaea]
MRIRTFRACQRVRHCTKAVHEAFPTPSYQRQFHDYFVTHLPTSSLHPDSARSATAGHHQLPRSASKPHTPESSKDPSPAPLVGVNRETTVVRIPLRKAKHHFGVSVSRGQRPYNEDTYQAGVIELPAFAKRAPVSLSSRVPASSPLQRYREEQQKRRAEDNQSRGQSGDGEGTSAEGASGDPQVFYFGLFDGHGGTECSGFLRESLHEYIEDAVRKFQLQSSLKGPEQKMSRSNDREESSQSNAKTQSAPGTANQPEPGESNSLPPEATGSSSPATALITALLSTWRDTVGGYFRRFSPPALFPTPSHPLSIPTIITYAFLSADLSFITAQARKSTTSTDPVLSDAPLNASDVWHSPSHRLAANPTTPPFKGGSTCSLALISTPSPTPFWHPTSPSTLITAHVGDSRILLCRTSDGKALPLTTNHHPSSPAESQRLRRYATSFVTDSFGEERMSGLANTRAFGDMSSKRLGVSAEPEIRRVELRAAEFSFLVLISDGVSGTLPDQEVVDVVKEAKTPEQGARDVVAFATEVSTEGDNATCLVVRLGGWERRGEGGVGSLGTRESREWRRGEAGDPRRRRT